MPNREPPKTKEGLYVSHLILGLEPEFRREPPEDLAESARSVLTVQTEFNTMERSELIRVVSGKADFMTLLFAETLEELEAFQRTLLNSCFGQSLNRIETFLSVTELSLYRPVEERVKKILKEKGITPEDNNYEESFEDQMQRMEKYQQARLKPDLPEMDYVTFYPMAKRRNRDQNWYQLPTEQRREMMMSHGEIGRRYAGKIQQIITSCVGLDDWEWGVTLYSDNPKEFKRLIYEMRFDEVSARYSDFGPFYTGFTINPESIGEFLPTG